MSAQLAFDGNDRAFHPALVMTAHYGRNDAMVASVARLWILTSQDAETAARHRERDATVGPP